MPTNESDSDLHMIDSDSFSVLSGAPRSRDRMGSGKSTLHSVNMCRILLQYLLLPQNVRGFSIVQRNWLLRSANRLGDDVIEASECFESVVRQWDDYSAILGFNGEVAGLSTRLSASRVKERAFVI